MPRFPGCENLEGTNEEKKLCADKKMLNYLYKNIRYPNKARKQEIEGTAIVRFVIEKDGTIEDIKVLRGLSKEISAVCKNLVEKMPKWTPGYKNGKPVRVQFNLPIKFRLK
jgi:protein TonB